MGLSGPISKEAYVVVSGFQEPRSKYIDARHEVTENAGHENAGGRKNAGSVKDGSGPDIADQI